MLIGCYNENKKDNQLVQNENLFYLFNLGIENVLYKILDSLNFSFKN